MKEEDRLYVSRVSVCTGVDAFRLIGSVLNAVRLLVDDDTALQGLRIEMEEYDGCTAAFVVSVDRFGTARSQIRE